MRKKENYKIDQFEHSIVSVISSNGSGSVDQVHTFLKGHPYLDVMRSIHKLCMHGFLIQKHIEGIAYYQLSSAMRIEAIAENDV